MTHAQPASPLARKIIWPIVLVGAFAAWGLITRTMTWFQLVSLAPVLYGLVVFTIGALVYRPRLAPDAEGVADDELPFVSILIPAHNEEFVIGHTLNHMLRLDYPRYEVIVIDDHSSDRTGAILREYAVKVVTRRNLPNRGKSEALNAGLEVAVGDVICVFDADSEVDPNFLRLAVAPLVNDPEVCGVQAQVRMYNRDHNTLTAMQDDEFALYNEILQVGRTVLGGASALGGNGQLTRRSAIHAVGGWSPSSLTEDLDLTMRLFLAGRGRIAHVTQAIVWQEGVADFKSLIRQRTRWAQGMLQCFGDYAGPVLRSPHMSWGLRLDAYYALFSVFLPLFTMAGIVYTVLSVVPGFFIHSLPFVFGTALSSSLIAFACIWSLVISFKRDRQLDVLPGLRYLVYILHWAPALVYAIANVLRDQPVVWVKTEHLGHDLVTSGSLSHTVPAARDTRPEMALPNQP